MSDPDRGVTKVEWHVPLFLGLDVVLLLGAWGLTLLVSDVSVSIAGMTVYPFSTETVAAVTLLVGLRMALWTAIALPSIILGSPRRFIYERRARRHAAGMESMNKARAALLDGDFVGGMRMTRRAAALLGDTPEVMELFAKVAQLRETGSIFPAFDVNVPMPRGTAVPPADPPATRSAEAR